jgi:3-deoxy-D-manno-octulosonate 8-phosphate phosphatase, YrbI family
MNILENFKAITTFVFDMDGVLTDGMLLHLSGTEWLRRTSMRDGHAIKTASSKGYRIVVLSGSISKPVKVRMEFLGVKDVFMAVADKKEKFVKYMKKHSLKPEEVLYMGDDIPDYKCMQIAGLPCCPADAAPEIRQIAKYISPFKGGEGCVRDVIEKVLKLHGKWEIE